MTIIRRTLYVLSALLLLLLFLLLVLFLQGFRFTPEGTLHSLFRDKTHIEAGEYDFWLNDVVDESGATVYGTGQTGVKKYGILYRAVDAAERKDLIDRYGDYVGSLTRYEGETSDYYFIHWASSIMGIEDGKYVTSMRYFTDYVEVNGKVVSLDYHCFFAFEGEIERIRVLGETITLTDRYEKPPVSLFAPEPEHTSLEFWITEDVGAVDFSHHHEVSGWMGARVFYGLGYAPEQDENGNEVMPRHYVTYKISAYPDYADGGRYVTEICITDPSVSVYGLTVNSSFADFESVFRRMGYIIEVKETGGTRLWMARKYNDICFYFDEGRGNGIPEITIRATVSNREGIEF